MKITPSRQTSLLPPPVELLRRRLERWRKIRRHGTPMPEELWASAAELAGQYGLARTARALRLDYYSLKARLKATARSCATGAEAPTFVEFVAPAPVGMSECTMELEHPSGARMRVHLKAPAVAGAAELSDAFWRAHR